MRNICSFLAGQSCRFALNSLAAQQRRPAMRQDRPVRQGDTRAVTFPREGDSLKQKRAFYQYYSSSVRQQDVDNIENV